MTSVRLIIPCFNEERRLPANEFVEFIRDNADVSFSFVNDGSTDDTLGVLEQVRAFAPERVEVIDLAENQGKAEAVRRGVLESLKRPGFDFVGYFDADLATPLDQLALLLAQSGAPPQHALIFGSRVAGPGVEIDRDPVRNMLGRLFSTCATVALKLDFHDTQCGAKIFSRDLASSVFHEPFISRWLFDLELFLRTRRQLGKTGFAEQVREVPLQKWQEKGTSKIRRVDLIRVPADLLRIWTAYRGV